MDWLEQLQRKLLIGGTALMVGSAALLVPSATSRDHEAAKAQCFLRQGRGEDAVVATQNVDNYQDACGPPYAFLGGFATLVGGCFAYRFKEDRRNSVGGRVA